MSSKTITERLNDIDDGLNNLLYYANETTQHADTDIGEAIRTLCDGYGQGGGSDTLTDKLNGTLKEYTYTGSNPLTAYLFSGDTNIEKVVAKNSTTINAYVFQNATNLKVFSIPRSNSINVSRSLNSFYKCNNLRYCDLGLANAVGNTCFQNCNNLKDIVIRKTSVCSITTNSFSGVTNSFSVYVPSALIESYKTATNWSTLYNAGTIEFKAIEGSTYENLDWADSIDLSTLE